MSDLKLDIEKLVYGGDGLAFHDNKPVFVPFVLPGEVIEAFTVQESRKLIRALPSHVAQPSDLRVEPACPHFTRCGGCHYQHMGADEQSQWKVNILAEQLRRLGGIEWDREIPVHSGEPWNYRNRVQFKFAPHPEDPALLQVGYYRAGSHVVEPVATCPTASPMLNEILEVLNRLCAERRLPLSFESLEAFADNRDESVSLVVTVKGFDFDLEEVTESLRTEISGILSLRYRDDEGTRTETDGLGWNYWHEGAHRWRVSHESFFQVNRHLVGETIARVTQGLEGRVALDLFAGVGLFTRALAEKFERVVAVEGFRAAAEDLRANTDDLEAVEVQRQRVADYLAGTPEMCDVAVLDPPRVGLGAEGVAALLELSPPRLVYLSCDPSTLARDLKELSKSFRISQIELIDLFPQTFHIETLVRLERSE